MLVGYHNIGSYSTVTLSALLSIAFWIIPNASSTVLSFGTIVPVTAPPLPSAYTAQSA